MVASDNQDNSHSSGYKCLKKSDTCYNLYSEPILTLSFPSRVLISNPLFDHKKTHTYREKYRNNTTV